MQKQLSQEEGRKGRKERPRSRQMRVTVLDDGGATVKVRGVGVG